MNTNVNITFYGLKGQGLIQSLPELYGQQGNYHLDSLVLYMAGHACLAESEPLGRALLSLPDKQKWVLLLGLWHDMFDRETGI